MCEFKQGAEVVCDGERRVVSTAEPTRETCDRCGGRLMLVGLLPARPAQ